jgi:hypothetical protein
VSRPRSERMWPRSERTANTSAVRIDRARGYVLSQSLRTLSKEGAGAFAPSFEGGRAGLFPTCVTLSDAGWPKLKIIGAHRDFSRLTSGLS